MAEAYIGEIRMFSFDFAPRGWATCDGQTLSIQQNTALFSLLGTTYGGNGVTTFQLPDLRSRAPIHVGNGPGLTPRVQGEKGGEESHTLLASEMPAHTHLLSAAGTATGKAPAAAVLAQNASKLFRSGATPTAALAATTLASVGGSQPHSNLQPYAVVNFAICLSGYFPSRN